MNTCFALSKTLVKSNSGILGCHGALKIGDKYKTTCKYKVISRNVSYLRKKVYVGMSGGVDSSVAAYILKKKGYNVEGVYMKNWDIRDELGRCTSDKDWSDVQKVCEQLEISCTRIDLVKEYWNRIFENVIEQYETGFTPNPDIMCNSEIKFGVLLEKLRNKAGRFGDDDIWFATGHYARIDQRPGETPRLFRGVDSSKDQSFFLSGVKAGSLQNVIFPLGELRKRDQVRQIALDLKLITAEKEESMGICFIGERKRFSEFMSQYITQRKGNIVDLDGNILATHSGIFSKTIGQASGLAINDKKWFICKKSVKDNTMVAVPGRDHRLLSTQKIYFTSIHWITKPSDYNRDSGFSAYYQARNLMKPEQCFIRYNTRNDIWEFYTLKPLYGATPGQTIAFYDGDLCLGSAKIADVAYGYRIKDDPLEADKTFTRLKNMVA